MILPRINENNGFLGFILQDEDFLDTMTAAVYTTHQGWYDKLVNMPLSDNLQFNNFCDLLISSRFEMLHSVAHRRRQRGSLHTYQSTLYEIMIYRGPGGTWTNLVESLPEQLQSDATPICLLLLHFSDLVLTWVREAIAAIHSAQMDCATSMDDGTSLLVTELSEESRRDELKKLVNRFVGWAVFSLNKKLEKDYGENERKIALLETMQIHEHEALLDSEYMENCYTVADQLRNKGGLCLISKQFFGFGWELMVAIGKLSVKTFEDLGNKTIEDEFDRIRSNAELREMFRLECRKSAFADDELSDKELFSVYDALCKKLFNAWAGVQSRKFKQQYTGRQVVGAAVGTFRGDMSAATRKPTVNNKKK